jgi:signal peptidase I
MIEKKLLKRKRYPSIAVVLALFISPALSMSYLGRGWRALFYFVLTIVVVATVFPLASNGLWPPGVSHWVPALLVTIVGAIDSYRIARQYRDEFSGSWYSRWYGVLGVLLLVVFVVFCIRAFVIEPFRIPSRAMTPTLVVGDYILVNKFTYGIRVPFVHIKLVDIGAPQRGEVAVFRYPLDPSIVYIKRVVGLPGDYLEYRNKQLYVNGEPIPQHPLPATGDNTVNSDELRMETLGDVNYTIQIRKSDDLSRGYSVHLSRGYKVPEGHYFMMGDNRDNSRDSRSWGPVPEQNLIGKAFLVWWNEEIPERSGTSLQ